MLLRDLIEELRRRDVVLFVIGDNLHLEGDAFDRVTDLEPVIEARRPELVEMIRNSPADVLGRVSALRRVVQAADSRKPGTFDWLFEHLRLIDKTLGDTEAALKSFPVGAAVLSPAPGRPAGGKSQKG